MVAEYSQISPSRDSKSLKTSGAIEAQDPGNRYCIEPCNVSDLRSKGGFKMKQMGFCASMSFFLLMTSTGFMSNYRVGGLWSMTPIVVTFAFSGQNPMPQGNVFWRTGSSPAANCLPGLSIADIIAVALFLAFIATHFCLCRKGVYPESSVLCQWPLWSRKLSTKGGRKATS